MSETASPEKPQKKKKKRATKAREGVPSFAARFPADPALDALLSAFDRGDYGTVRKDGSALVKSAESDAVRRSAEELLRRIEPDPLAKMLVLGASVLLLFFVLWYFTHRITP